MIEKILGIDLGIASLGWAVIEYDKEHDANNKIIDCGVRLFTAAETPKDHKSLNEARRNARGIRRVIKRRRVRMNEIKKLCIAHELLGQDDIDLENGIFNASKKENPKASRIDVWELRHDALSRKLSGEEFARILIHIAKHRGYKFNGDDEADEESGKVKKAGMELRGKFETAGCRSVGEWLWNERRHHGRKRNKSGDYEISIHRDFLVAEIDTVFAEQHRLGNDSATEELKKLYKDIAFYVRPMQSIEEMVGYCTFFPKDERKNLKGEKRAAKASPTAERFVALGKFFSTVIVDNQGNERKIIELKNIDELMQFATSKESLTYKQLRDFLELKNDFSIIFKGLSYKSKKSETTEWEKVIKETETKPWISLKGHTTFRKALEDEKFNSFIANIDLADKAATTLTYFKDERQKRDDLTKLGLDLDTVEALCKIGFTNFNQLSIKAMRIINQIMIDGYQRYDEAVRYALEHNLLPKIQKEKDIFLPPLKDTDIDILNPTVIRAFAQFRKVANALVRKYGSFDKVHFELARDVNTKGDIDNIKKGIAKNTKERAEAEAWITENFPGTPTTRKNILKKRLFEQQGEFCPYTGEKIKLDYIFDEGYCEIDHILPRSRSADDSQANKVLCMSKANQDKTNRTPYEWFGHDNERWERFEARMNASSNLAKMGKGKVSRLLKKNFDENSEIAFKERNLNDTRYMAKAIKTYCENYWALAHEDDKLRIQIRSGKLTSELRSRWIEGYMKDRSIHTHHALDAIVIAFATQSMVQKLSTYYGAKETRRAKEKPIFNPPMEHFREAVEKALTLERSETVTAKDGHEVILNRLLISRPPRASVTGAAHKETIQSPSDYKGRGVSINNGKGICDNGDMPRVDVFTKVGKYYLVPIYVADFAKEELPNKAIVQGKGKEWIEMDESYQFLFSLAKDDIVSIKVKNKDALFGFFGGVHSGTAGISIKMVDTSEEISGIGSKTAEYIKKYTIDPLGYYHEVKHETRLGTIPQEQRKRRG